MVDWLVAWRYADSSLGIGIGIGIGIGMMRCFLYVVRSRCGAGEIIRSSAGVQSTSISISMWMGVEVT